ncbi:hypothetical protein [Candidatus Methylobacter favarea]|uniref:hypothetical protein n=1 Tax=Candidatus Methylobacter favarea TaxID=2707345 RepID=UPI001FE4D72A|nr:hypothetical protein [Candidatus Methylobacter favarea]
MPRISNGESTRAFGDSRSIWTRWSCRSTDEAGRKEDVAAHVQLTDTIKHLKDKKKPSLMPNKVLMMSLPKHAKESIIPVAPIWPIRKPAFYTSP